MELAYSGDHAYFKTRFQCKVWKTSLTSVDGDSSRNPQNNTIIIVALGFLTELMVKALLLKTTAKDTGHGETKWIETFYLYY